jgi:predicted ATPase/DNA-binding SARP family transcriptional activator
MGVQASTRHIEFRVLGPIEVLADGQPLVVSGRRQRALLAALLLRRGSVVPIPQLVDDVFGDTPPVDGRNALQTCMVRLRQALGPGASRIVTSETGYALAVGPGEVDADRFIELLDAAKAATSPATGLALLEEALSRWRGAVFAEFAAGFAGGEAARLEEIRTTAGEDRAQLLLTLGRCADAVAALEIVVAEHPWRERAVALLVTALGRCGRTADALAAYNTLRDRLREELGLDPSPDLQRLHQQLLRGQLGAPTRQQSRIPAPVTRLFGRDGELADIEQLVAAERLTTLVGPGGVGKSRLAAEIADRYPQARWVDLAALRDGAAVWPAVSEAAGLDVQPGVPLRQLVVTWARAAQGLVVLDNCEHLLGVVAELAAELMAVSVALRLLATSRERLAVPGERVFVVAPLHVSDAGRDGPDNPAVQLFVDRARAADAGLRPDAGMRATIGLICRALDGLPLAIELAAARTGTFTVDDLAMRLDARFDLLTRPRALGDPRHSGLISVVEWSYELLTEEERYVFLRLSVFASAFDIDAAESIVADDAVPRQRIADVLGRLADQSMLVRPGAAGSGRYRLLQTLRSYAANRLNPEDSKRLHRRHAEHFTALVERSQAGLYSVDEQMWVERLEEWLDDIRAAAAWARQSGCTDIAVRLAAAIGRFAYWRLRQDLLAWGLWVATNVTADAQLADAIAAGAHAAWMAGHLAEARELAEQAVEAAGGAGSPAAVAALEARGDVALLAGNAPAALQAYRTVVEHTAKTGDQTARHLGETNVALMQIYSGAPADGMAEVLSAAQGIGNPTARAYALFTEGEVIADEDPSRALTVFEDARRLANTVHNRFVSGIALSAEVAVRGRHGPPDTALALFRQAIEHWRATGNRMLLIITLRNLVVLFARTGRDQAAARLAASLDRDAPSPSYGAEAERIRTGLAAVRHRLGEKSYTEANTPAPSLEAAADEALRLLADGQ